MKFTAKTFYGLEAVLADELKELGASDIEVANRAVMFTGNKEMLYTVNYCSRIALSVLLQVKGFRISSGDELYRKASGIDWSSIMDENSTFSVTPVVHSDLFRHSQYPALVLKDAIADYFRERSGRRPSVNGSDPDVALNLHISNNQVDISLDSSVIPLFKRGYRAEQGLAPLNEVLAAGMLRLSGWDGSIPLYDPMCGSGTILIEAGMMAAGIPAGSFRKSFGFSRWNNFDESLFKKVKEKASKEITDQVITISGSDISEAAVKQAKVNIDKAGLGGIVSVETAGFGDSVKKSEKGYLIFNPPYGVRIKPEETESLYRMIGSTLKHNYAGYHAWIITSEREYLNNIGLKPARKYILYNGSIECIFAGYELYEGSKKRTG